MVRLTAVLMLGLWSPVACFTVPSGVQSRGLQRLAAASSDASTAIVTRQVVSEEDVVNLASFRNDLTNPEMMVANAKGKSSDVDNTGAALEGVKIGLGYIGVPCFGYDYWQDGDVGHALQFSCKFGTIE